MAQAATPAATLPQANSPAVQQPVEVNKASQAELEMIKGLGPQLSSKMVTARSQQPFKDWQDLIQRMSGIGPVKAGKLSASGLVVNGSSYSAPAVVAPTAGKAASRVKGG